MSLSEERLQRLNSKLNKRQSKNDKKREELKQVCQDMADRMKASNDKVDEIERGRYEVYFKDFKSSVKKSGGIFRKVKYAIDVNVKGFNPLDGRGGWEIFGEIFRVTHNHKREWDHKPSDEEIYDFVYEVYGKPKYMTRKEVKSVSYKVSSCDGMYVKGVYHKFDDLEKEPEKLLDNL